MAMTMTHPPPPAGPPWSCISLLVSPKDPRAVSLVLSVSGLSREQASGLCSKFKVFLMSMGRMLRGLRGKEEKTGRGREEKREMLRKIVES